MNYKGKYTNTPAGVERAIYELKSFGRAEAQKVIILLTDGIVDTGNKAQDLEKAEWLRQDLSSESKDAGIRIFGIAFTDNADFSLIQTLASRTGGEYFRAYTAEDIPAVFEKITVVITRPAFKKEMPAPPAPKLPPPETKVFVPSQAAPDAATSVKEEKALLPLILSAVAVGLLVILVVLAFKRKPADQVPQSVPEKLVEEELPPDHPIFKAELIDVDHIVSDETLSLTLNKLLVTIGRDDNNDIVIPKDSISSLHASIDYRNGYFYLEDHRSTNGTRLNHKDLEENKPVRLKSGDKIHFAVYEFRFLLPDQAPFGETVFLSKDDM